MNAQLKELIEKIQKDGVATAEEKAASIIKDAKKEGEEIISQAEVKAEKIISQAKKDAERMEQSGKEALQQAARDLLLTVRKELEKIFDGLINYEVSQALNNKVLEEAVITVVTAWAKEDTSDLQILLSEKDKKSIQEILLSKLSIEIKKGVEIKAAPGISSGFRVEEKDGSAYYNFTSEGIAEALAQYLNPALGEIINRAKE